MHEFDNDHSKITAASPRVHWVHEGLLEDAPDRIFSCQIIDFFFIEMSKQISISPKLNFKWTLSVQQQGCIFVIALGWLDIQQKHSTGIQVVQ